ncbi:unnamed protein product [Rotaria socialis]|uniref:HTH CENPB-type domain-containing protein n=2 Tax=Rotaria socialis TaxID=392032 RepID=A0A818RI45_9BILA|nr:unnamed protein product [Rotaria socialis]
MDKRVDTNTTSLGTRVEFACFVGCSQYFRLGIEIQFIKKSEKVLAGNRPFPLSDDSSPLERSSVHLISTTEEEISIAINLLDLLEDLSNSDSFTIETEDSLEISGVDHFDPDYPVEIADDGEQRVGENRQFSLEYMQRVVDFARSGIAFATVQHAFRRVTHPMQLKRFREYVANNGNCWQKLERVEHFVLDRFRSACDNNVPVRDLDVKRWALFQAKIENIDGFKASDYWLLNFKKRNGIFSRKVTKFVSHREVVDKSIIKQTVDDFAAEATKEYTKILA